MEIKTPKKLTEGIQVLEEWSAKPAVRGDKQSFNYISQLLEFQDLQFSDPWESMTTGQFSSNCSLFFPSEIEITACQAANALHSPQPQSIINFNCYLQYILYHSFLLKQQCPAFSNLISSWSPKILFIYVYSLIWTDVIIGCHTFV